MSEAPQSKPQEQDLEKSEGQPQELPEEKELITQFIHEHEGHTHHYVWGATTPSGLKEAICSCGHGLQIHESIHGIADGKITNVQSVVEIPKG